jgi:hypothetical protein
MLLHFEILSCLHDKHDEKKARREEKFNSAALVIGKAKDEQKQ